MLGCTITDFHAVSSLPLVLNLTLTFLCLVKVSNAGMGLIGPIECQSIDEMKTVMDTNFFGLVRLLKEILPDMKKRKKGHIVVISSVMGIQGEGGSNSLLTFVAESDVRCSPFQGFCSMTSMQHPSLQWKDFVRAWQYKP